MQGRKTKLAWEMNPALGENPVRTIAMNDTKDLVRGQKVLDFCSPIKILVGSETFGRIMNVIVKKSVDKASLKTKQFAPLCAKVPELMKMNIEQEISECESTSSLCQEWQN